MGLHLLWQNSRTEVESKHIQQIIAFAGKGKLLDDSSTSHEFREFLRQVPSTILCRYVDECFSSKFEDSGLALQDVVNQIGQRLGFQVEYGRYRGTRNDVGHDGLWRFPDRHSVVVEVKTTDAFRIDTDKIADYRKKLIGSNAIDEDQSSILIIVGREDTGGLEAQIRGSRHAWDIRLISVDALMRLLSLKEAVDDPKIIQKICAVLIPREFTRVDEIIDIVFTAAEEAKSEEILVGPDEEIIEDADVGQPGISRPAAFHDACVQLFSQARNLLLVKRTRNTYLTPDGKTAVVCVVSKAHGNKQNRTSYWFAFHPYQKEFLETSGESFFVLGCGSKSQILVIPFSDLKTWLDDLWTTELEDRMYWHIRFQQEGTKFLLNRKKGVGNLDVTHYLLK